MAWPWETEPTATYAKNLPKYPSARYQFDERTQQILAEIRGTTSYGNRPSPSKSPLEEGLSWLGRPLEATTSAVGAGLRGGDVGGEFVRGLQGLGRTKDWTQLLEQQGAPEMGRLQ